MLLDLPVVWKLNDTTSTGRLQVADDRLTLHSRSRTLAFLTDSIQSLMIERSPGERMRGLPVLRLGLDSGIDVRVASLGGAGSLHDLAALIAPRQAVPVGT